LEEGNKERRGRPEEWHNVDRLGEDMSEVVVVVLGNLIWNLWSVGHDEAASMILSEVAGPGQEMIVRYMEKRSV
jgi:hypothetical protein